MAYEKYGFNDNKTKYDLSDIDNLKNQVQNIQTDILQKIYPIGSVYFSTSKTNPADSNVLGFGTWTEITTSQRFLVLTPTNVGSAKQTGGVNSFKLNANQLPDHAHRIETTFSNNGVYDSAKQPWGNVRVIPKGTGGSSGVTPYDLGYGISSRRGYGNDVTSIGNGWNMNVYRKYSTLTELNNSFALETTAGKEHQAQKPDVVEANISDKLKIEGFTGPGIYTKEVYDSTKPQPNGSYVWADLAQTTIDNRPAYVTIYAWERTR